MTEVEMELNRTREKLGHVADTLMQTDLQNRELKGWLKECRNELCLRCGSYKTAHEGSCDGCKWKDDWRALAE